MQQATDIWELKEAGNKVATGAAESTCGWRFDPDRTSDDLTNMRQRSGEAKDRLGGWPPTHGEQEFVRPDEVILWAPARKEGSQKT